MIDEYLCFLIGKLISFGLEIIPVLLDLDEVFLVVKVKTNIDIDLPTGIEFLRDVKQLMFNVT